MSEWLSERRRNGGLDEVPLPLSTDAGHLFLCGKHLIGPDADALLARTGASVAVCLNEEHELAGRYPDYVDWLRANVGPNGRAVWSPIPDMHVPSVEVFAALIDSLRARLDQGDGMVVHCGAGIGRAGTVAAALLMSMGESLEVALTTVATARPAAGPQTFNQDELLVAYAARLGRG